jgi:pyridoxine 5-phosphate synthase
MALLAELAGANGITYDLRGEHRVEAERDARLLRACLSGRLEIVLAAGPELLDLAYDLSPKRITLAPERRSGGAAMSGLDAQTLGDVLRRQVLHLRDAGIEVGVRVEPELEQIKALHRAEADLAILNTSVFMRASTSEERRTEAMRLGDAAALARRLKISVAVGGELDLEAAEELARFASITEFQVGHACIARAMLTGVENAVRDFSNAIERGRRRAF